MKNLEFYKVQASGNDFILFDAIKYKKLARHLKYKEFARTFCKRKYGAGADGLLVIEPSKSQDFRMRIFNPDGSEAEMCGNGARCAAFWAAKFLNKKAKNEKRIIFETMAGDIEAEVRKPIKKKIKTKPIAGKGSYANVRIKMSDPFDLKLILPIKLRTRVLKVNFINTGVPHTVIFVERLDSIDVEKTGRVVRRHERFRPQGTNVNFVEVLKNDLIKVRTYERGVEAETFACGTGVVASAIISWIMTHGSWLRGKKVIRVKVKSQDILKVHFHVEKEKIKDVWLEGQTCCLYRGVLI